MVKNGAMLTELFAVKKKQKEKEKKRRGDARRVKTERRGKGRWNPKDEDRREGFGRRKQDKAWDRINSKFD
jgi:hypothetical protein